jgi:hypothetical protein
MTEDDKLFKIEKVSGEIKVDERKTKSPYNSIKNFKYANLPAQCNDCVYRSRDDGGNGKCSVYEKDAACAIRKDIAKFLNQLDTRSAEDLKGLLDFLAKLNLENYLMANAQSRLDGNIPDRNTRSEINSILGIMKLITEMSSKIQVSESKTFNKSGDISNIFRELKKS